VVVSWFVLNTFASITHRFLDRNISLELSAITVMRCSFAVPVKTFLLTGMKAEIKHPCPEKPIVG